MFSEDKCKDSDNNNGTTDSQNKESHCLSALLLLSGCPTVASPSSSTLVVLRRSSLPCSSSAFFALMHQSQSFLFWSDICAPEHQREHSGGGAFTPTSPSSAGVKNENISHHMN